MELKKENIGLRGKPLITSLALSIFASNVFLGSLNSSLAENNIRTNTIDSKNSLISTDKKLISYELREIPDKSESIGKNRLNFGRNPFAEPSLSASNQETSKFLLSTSISATIFIGKEKSALIRTFKGSDYYKTGDEVGEGYIVKEITSSPTTVTLSNGKLEKTYLLKEK